MKNEVPGTCEELLAEVRRLYEQHGCEALSTTFLEKRGLYVRLRKVGLKQPEYLSALGLTDQFEKWKFSNRTYAGKPQLRWSWDRALETARQAMEDHGELPSMEWFRRNQQTSLVNAVFRSGHSWEQLRESLGNFKKSTFRQSRNGMRWLSQPETSLSDFFHARGIQHTRGRRYDSTYAEVSGRRHGTYDMHFLATDGRWIDVEIWGDLPESLSGGTYAQTRALKEAWNTQNPNFLGIQFKCCYSEEKLETILEPYIGVIAPFNFEKTSDPYIKTAHWTSADEVLETCRQVAAQRPDGILPNEQWLRKRGKYADREGDTYNSLAIQIQRLLGGTRNARRLLDQASGSTNKWTPESAIKAWRDFHATYGVAPSALATGGPAGMYSAETVKRANAIRVAAIRHGVLEEARQGRKGRELIWTPETIQAAWTSFEQKYGFPPSMAVGTKRRTKYSKEIGNEAARIYAAAIKSGILDLLRDQGG